MKTTLLFVYLLAILFETCDQTLPTAVIHATSQSWSGGAAGSGHGTNYYIYLRGGDVVNFEFDSLWVNNKRLVAEIRTKESNSDTTIVYAGDVVRGIVPDGENVPLVPCTGSLRSSWFARILRLSFTISPVC